MYSPRGGRDGLYFREPNTTNITFYLQPQQVLDSHLWGKKQKKIIYT